MNTTHSHYGNTFKPVKQPTSTIGICRTWLRKKGRKTNCPTYGRPVELGNGWCMVCWDRKVSLKYKETMNDS